MLWNKVIQIYVILFSEIGFDKEVVKNYVIEYRFIINSIRIVHCVTDKIITKVSVISKTYICRMTLKVVMKSRDIKYESVKNLILIRLRLIKDLSKIVETHYILYSYSRSKVLNIKTLVTNFFQISVSTKD